MISASIAINFPNKSRIALADDWEKPRSPFSVHSWNARLHLGSCNNSNLKKYTVDNSEEVQRDGRSVSEQCRSEEGRATPWSALLWAVETSSTRICHHSQFNLYPLQPCELLAFLRLLKSTIRPKSQGSQLHIGWRLQQIWSKGWLYLWNPRKGIPIRL